MHLGYCAWKHSGERPGVFVLQQAERAPPCCQVPQTLRRECKTLGKIRKTFENSIRLYIRAYIRALSIVDICYLVYFTELHGHCEVESKSSMSFNLLLQLPVILNRWQLCNHKDVNIQIIFVNGTQRFDHNNMPARY